MQPFRCCHARPTATPPKPCGRPSVPAGGPTLTLSTSGWSQDSCAIRQREQLNPLCGMREALSPTTLQIDAPL